MNLLVVFGPTDVEVLGRYGAQKIYAFDDMTTMKYLVAPKAEALAALVVDKQPAALLVTATTEGKEIGARVALQERFGVHLRRR